MVRSPDTISSAVGRWAIGNNQKPGKVQIFRKGIHFCRDEAPAGKIGDIVMKATGIVRRIDDLGRVVIPKEIRRTMRIREGDPTLTTLTPVARFLYALMDLSKRIGLN